MPNTRQSDLKEFGEWLQSERYYAKNTTHTMVSNVRRILREVPDLSVEALEDFFKYDLRRSSPAKSAWRRFGEWAKTKGVEVPMPAYAARAAEPSMPRHRLPGNVCNTLSSLKRDHRVPLEIFLRLRWKHVQPGRNHIEGKETADIADPTEAGTFWAVPALLLDSLREWGNPEDPLSLLLPAVPGSMELLTPKQAEWAIKEAKKNDDMGDGYVPFD